MTADSTVDKSIDVIRPENDAICYSNNISKAYSADNMGKKRHQKKSAGCVTCGGQYNVLVQDPGDWSDQIQSLEKKSGFDLGNWLQSSPTRFVHCKSCGAIWQLWYSSYDGCYSQSRKLKGRRVAALKDNSSAEHIAPLLSCNNHNDNDLATQWFEYSKTSSKQKVSAILEHLNNLLLEKKLDNRTADKLCTVAGRHLSKDASLQVDLSQLFAAIKQNLPSQNEDEHKALAYFLKRHYKPEAKEITKPSRENNQPPGIDHARESPAYNPMTRLSSALAILIATTLLILFCSQFYAEENIQTGTYATAGVTNILMPAFLWWVFKQFKWTHGRSAMTYIAAITITIAAIGHYDFYHFSIKTFARIHLEEQRESNEINTLELLPEKEIYRHHITSQMTPSGWLFLDHLRFRAQYGTWSQEKAYYHGPMIEVYRSGFWVWFNWIIQLFILWLVGAIIFVLCGPKVDDDKQSKR